MTSKPRQENLLLRVLVPVCAGLLFILVAGYYAYQLQYQNSVESYTEYQATLFDTEFRGEIEQKSAVLQAVHALLEGENGMRAALAAGDTQGLYQLGVPIFNRLRETVGITHFYFSDVDRVNLIRMHAPSRNGDRIDRLTMLAAETSDALALGIDLGPLGTLTLRAVAPWFDESGNKIGYLELGIDVEHILENIARQNDFGIALAIPKSALQKDLWTIGNQYFEGSAQWDRYQNFVTGREHWLSKRQYLNLPDLDLLANQSKPMEGTSQLHEHYFWSRFPISNLNGVEIGKAILAIEVTDLAHYTESIAIKISVVYAVVALALVLVIYRYIKRTIVAEGELNETIDQLEHLATFDQLTGLPNRYLFIKEFEQRLRESSRFAHYVGLAFIDVDNFKQVNDNWGHNTGDELLKEVAQRMAEAIRDYDVLARFGGDEFVLMMPQTNQEQAAITAQKLVESFNRPIKLRDNQVTVGLSIGVSVFPEHGESRELLLKHADIAMYKAKEEGKGCFRLYNVDMKLNEQNEEKSRSSLRLVT